MSKRIIKNVALTLFCISISAALAHSIFSLKKLKTVVNEQQFALEMVGDLQREYLETADNLSNVARHGTPEQVDNLAEQLLYQGPDSREKKYFKALAEAIRGGKVENVRAILPYTNAATNNSYALLLAVNWKNPEIVKLLIPVTNPKANGSAALAFAMSSDNHELIDILLPVSDEADARLTLAKWDLQAQKDAMFR
ncbi:ankyrin repeat domain-containing protein [Xanthomonas axonopodis]